MSKEASDGNLNLRMTEKMGFLAPSQKKTLPEIPQTSQPRGTAIFSGSGKYFHRKIVADIE